MQNGFVKAYCSLNRFRTGASFRPWLLRIVVNEAHNVLRDRRRHARLGARAAEQREVHGPGPDEVVIGQAEIDTVLAALGRLSKADRLVLALRYFAELPDREGAMLAGTSTKAYRVRLVRARRRLQQMLEEIDD
jgi:RNA polymerase sigma-70 factor (ECF subfamily)